MNEINDEAMMLYIGRVSADEKLNAKAKEFAGWIRQFGESIILGGDVDFLQGRIEAKIEELNEKYPRTKPFELYGSIYHHLHVVPVGKPEQTVAHAAVHEVKSTIDKGRVQTFPGSIMEVNLKFEIKK